MSVTVVTDTINDYERYITLEMPSQMREALLARAPKTAIKTKSMQCVISDSHTSTVSFLVDDIHQLAVLAVNEERVNLTMHDAVKVANFWNDVVARMR